MMQSKGLHMQDADFDEGSEHNTAGSEQPKQNALQEENARGEKSGSERIH